MEFNLIFVPQKSIKGRVLADFLANHPSTDIDPQVYDELESSAIFLTPWILTFDGSSKADGVGAGIVIISPVGRKTSLSFFLDFKCSNNQSEYETLIIGLEILIKKAVGDIKILGDSNLVLCQITEDFKCLSWQLRLFHSLATSLMNQFDNVQLKFWPSGQNKEANNMA
ncbi:uncharacterized protein LOC132282178 [Cornus florida]|uniref:uncharacterized protein LOC132282178 n=1 Tax=Cornus florida TaxID=4283 RepID=UPI00289941B9|nr:uncharacterized protein LOC132282178 [Cornus florida]